MTGREKSNFKAVLSPNSSLGQRGFVILMSIICVFSIAVGAMFTIMGAWPVFGFFGLDVLFLYWAFKSNFRNGVRREIIEVTENEVIVLCSTLKYPSQEYRFNKRWVRLELVEDKARELVGALNLHGHGKTLEVGSFLGADERKEFYLAFRRALV